MVSQCSFICKPADLKETKEWACVYVGIHWKPESRCGTVIWGKSLEVPEMLLHTVRGSVKTGRGEEDTQSN
jgi:hypothetical protein